MLFNDSQLWGSCLGRVRSVGGQGSPSVNPAGGQRWCSSYVTVAASEISLKLRGFRKHLSSRGFYGLGIWAQPGCHLRCSQGCRQGVAPGQLSPQGSAGAGPASSLPHVAVGNLSPWSLSAGDVSSLSTRTSPQGSSQCGCQSP